MPQEDGLKFCTNCGAPLEVQEPVTENTENIENAQFQPQNEQFTPAPANGGALDMVKDFFADSKKRMIAIGAAVLVLAVIIIVCLLPKGSSVSRPTTSLLPMSDGSEIFIFSDGKKLSTKIDGVPAGIDYNLDCDIILLTSYDTSYNKSDSDILYDVTNKDALSYYMVTTKEVKKITNDAVNTIKMNAEGGKAAYTNDEHVLYLYDGKNTKQIDANVGSFVISPNGKSLLYTKSEKYDPDYTYSIDEEAPGIDLYMYDGKKSTQLDKDKNSTPKAISDDCKYMYITRQNDSHETSLYTINKKGDPQKLGQVKYVEYLNRDHSQIIFSDDDRVYVSIKGKEKIKLSDSIDDIITECTNSGVTLSLKDVKGMVYTNGSHVFKINNTYETYKLKSSVIDPSISDDGKTLFYIKEKGSSYSLYSERIGTENPILLCDDIYGAHSYTATYDGKYVYYVDGDDTLYVVQSNGNDKKRVYDDVEGIAGILHNGTVLFCADKTDDEYTLYSVTGKKEKVRISDDVSGFEIRGNTAYYMTDKTKNDDGKTKYTVSILKDGKKPIKLMDDAGGY